MVSRLKRVKKSTWIRFFVGLILLSSIAYGVTFSPLRNIITFNNIVSLVAEAQHSPWSSLIFYCFFILAVLALPITIFPIIGGVLFNFWLALPLNVLACTIGGWLAFSIARFFGRDAVAVLLRGQLKLLDRMAAVEGFRTVLVLRLLGVPPFIVANYALGLSAIRNRDYLIGTALGITPWVALITFASRSLWEAVLVGGQRGFSVALFKIMGPMMLLSFGVITTSVIVYLIRRRSRTTALYPPAHSNL